MSENYHFMDAHLNSLESIEQKFRIIQTNFVHCSWEMLRAFSFAFFENFDGIALPSNMAPKTYLQYFMTKQNYKKHTCPLKLPSELL